MLRQTRDSILVGAVLGVVAGSPTLAHADYTWTYSHFSTLYVEKSQGNQGLFTFTPPVATGMPQYDWQYQIVEVWIQTDQFGGRWEQLGKTIGSSGSSNALPLSMLENWVVQQMNPFPNQFDLLIGFTVNHWVDDLGRGRLDITNINWGKEWPPLGTPYNVIRLGFDGWVNVTPVPEPAGILALLSGAGTLGLIAARRRRR